MRRTMQDTATAPDSSGTHTLTYVLHVIQRHFSREANLTMRV